MCNRCRRERANSATDGLRAGHLPLAEISGHRVTVDTLYKSVLLRYLSSSALCPHPPSTAFCPALIRHAPLVSVCCVHSNSSMSSDDDRPLDARPSSHVHSNGHVTSSNGIGNGRASNSDDAYSSMSEDEVPPVRSTHQPPTR